MGESLKIGIPIPEFSGFSPPQLYIQSLQLRIEKLYSYLMICEVQVMVRNENLGDSDEMPTTTPSKCYHGYHIT